MHAFSWCISDDSGECHTALINETELCNSKRSWRLTQALVKAFEELQSPAQLDAKRRTTLVLSNAEVDHGRSRRYSTVVSIDSTTSTGISGISELFLVLASMCPERSDLKSDDIDDSQLHWTP